MVAQDLSNTPHAATIQRLTLLFIQAFAGKATVRIQSPFVANVPEYWVVNWRDHLVEVHTDIVAGTYSRVTPYRPGERIALRAFADVVVAASDVLV